MIAVTALRAIRDMPCDCPEVDGDTDIETHRRLFSCHRVVAADALDVERQFLTALGLDVAAVERAASDAGVSLAFLVRAAIEKTCEAVTRVVPSETPR